MSPTPSLRAIAATVLPEALLTPINGLQYAPPAAGDAATLAVIASYAAHPSSLGGALVRTITYRGRPVGGIEILRLSVSVPTTQITGTGYAMLKEYAQKAPTSATLAGRPVQQVDAARGTKIGAVLWIAGTDVYIIWSSGVKDARTIGAAYLRV